MRRSLVVLIAVTLLASLPGLASARSLKVRFDPNDSPAHTDIRRVVSDLSESTVYLRIGSWERFHRWDADGGYQVWLDSGGDRRLDRLVEIYANEGGFTCLVEVVSGGDPSAFVGDLPATRPTPRSVACSLPRSWFPRIHRAVRFIVFAQRDRAPDRGMFIWL
jgi:hypothetical protein